MIQVLRRQHRAPHQYFFSEHNHKLPAVEMDCRRSDGELEIFSHSWIDSHNVPIFYRYFNHFHSVM